MSSTKFRKVEQKPAVTRREQYENALTPDRLKGRPKKVSYVEISLGEGGGTANVYFLPLSAADVIKFRDPALQGFKALKLMIDLLARKVVDPFTGKPLQTEEEWAEEDQDFLFQVVGAITGLQFVVEGEEVPESELVEVDIEALKVEPNPLDETPGSDSPIAST